MADPISLLINSFTALGAIFLSFVLIYFPEHRRKRKETRTQLLLLLKNLTDLAFRIGIEIKDKAEIYHHMIFNSEADYVEEKIRMHVKKFPESNEPDDYIDLLDEYVFLLHEASSSWVYEHAKITEPRYKLAFDVYKTLQERISGRL